MPFNDIYRLRIYQRLHTAQVVNVMHFVQDDPIPTRGALELAQDFVTNMRVSLTGRCSNQVQFEYVEVQSIVPFSGAAAIVAFPANTTGTVSGPTASATLAEVVTIYSERAGRRGRGRIYLPPTETFNSVGNNGLWASSQTTRTQTFATALATRYMGTAHPIGWILGVWSRAIAGPNPPWSTDAFAKGSGLTVRTTIRTQRRRQLGVGR